MKKSTFINSLLALAIIIGGVVLATSQTQALEIEIGDTKDVFISTRLKVNNLNCSNGQVIVTGANGYLECGSATGGVTGTGTANYTARWTGASTLGTGVLYDNGTNVGIGTNSPNQKLTVSGMVNAGHFYTGYNWTTKNKGINLGVDGISGGIGFYDGSTAWSASIFREETTSNFYVGVRGGAIANGITITSSSDVGIGTTNPQVRLDVNGGIRTTYSAQVDSDVVNKAYLNSSLGAVTLWKASGNNIYNANTGNVGIGTSNPGINKLNVVGGPVLLGGSVFSGPTSTSILRIASQGTPGTVRPYIELMGVTAADTTNENGGATIKFRTSTSVGYGPEIGGIRRSGGAGDMIFRTGGSNVQERMRILDNGNVGIGTTNPGAKLEINNTSGPADITLIHQTSGNYRRWRIESGNTYAVDAFSIKDTSEGAFPSIPEFMITRSDGNGTGRVGIGTNSPQYKLDINGQVRSLGFVYDSDIRLKKDVRTISGALDKVLALRGVNFTWKENGKPSVGLIAQEVEKIFPELVSGDDEKGVQYGNLVAPLIEAVKEQQKIINNLEARLSILEIKNKSK